MRPTTISDIDVAILCGGEGKRLHSMVADRPKPLVHIEGRPFLEILVENLISRGFTRIILSVGYLREHIINHFSDSRFKGLKGRDFKIEFSKEESPLGTGGAVKKTLALIKSDHFLVLNGDSFLDVDFERFYKEHLKNDSLVSVVLVEMPDIRDYGSVAVSGNNRITSFNEKIQEKKRGLINAGIYLINKKEIFSHLPEEDVFSLEYDFFPRILNRHGFGFVNPGPFIDIGTPERYKEAQKLLPLLLRKKKADI